MVTKRAMEASDEPSLVGRLVAGKYAVEKLLGDGSMGAVYRARRTDADAFVALKVLHPSVAVDPAYTARFKREAKAAARLEHPNSVRVIDSGEEPDGLLFIAMEYVDGRDLHRVMHEDWPLPDEHIADILVQPLAAIAVAHRMGVVHRDLKPENLMVLPANPSARGSKYIVKVCDFGIAKILGESPPGESSVTDKLTVQGMLIGTPEYMSPEQARGEAPEPRSDIYALGVILYQLLTGRTPFVGESMLAVVLQHITKEPEPPSVHFPEVHEGLAAVCMKALSKAPSDRYASAEEMRDAIASVIDVPSLRRPDGSDAPVPPASAGLGMLYAKREPAIVEASSSRRRGGWARWTGPVLLGLATIALLAGLAAWYVKGEGALARSEGAHAMPSATETLPPAPEVVAEAPAPLVAPMDTVAPEALVDGAASEGTTLELAASGDAAVQEEEGSEVDASTAPAVVAPVRRPSKAHPTVKKKRKRTRR